MESQTSVSVWPHAFAITLGVLFIALGIYAGILAMTTISSEPVERIFSPEANLQPLLDYAIILTSIGAALLFIFETVVATGFLVVGFGLLTRHEWARHDAALLLTMTGAAAVAFILAFVFIAGPVIEQFSTPGVDGAGTAALNQFLTSKDIAMVGVFAIACWGLAIFLEISAPIQSAFEDTHHRPVAGVVRRPKH